MATSGGQAVFRLRKILQRTENVLLSFCSYIKEIILQPAYLFGKIFGVLPVSFSKETGTRNKNVVTEGKIQLHAKFF